MRRCVVGKVGSLLVPVCRPWEAGCHWSGGRGPMQGPGRGIAAVAERHRRNKEWSLSSRNLHSTWGEAGLHVYTIKSLEKLQARREAGGSFRTGPLERD